MVTMTLYRRMRAKSHSTFKSHDVDFWYYEQFTGVANLTCNVLKKLKTVNVNQCIFEVYSIYP